MNFLTDFADQAVALPLAPVVALCLAAQGWRRGALAWLAAVFLTFASVLALKLGFLACGPVFAPFGMVSPSGHTAAAGLLAGGLAGLRFRRAALAAAAIAAGLIAITRVALGAHTWPEVALGGAVGVAGALILSRLSGPPPLLRLLPIGAAALAVVALLHGRRLPAEAAIRAGAAWVEAVPAICRQVLP